MSNCLDFSLRKIEEDRFLEIPEIKDLSALISPRINIDLFIEKLSKYCTRVSRSEVKENEKYLTLTQIGNIYSLGAVINKEIYLIDNQNKERKFNYSAMERMVHSVWKTNKY